MAKPRFVLCPFGPGVESVLIAGFGKIQATDYARILFVTHRIDQGPETEQSPFRWWELPQKGFRQCEVFPGLPLTSEQNCIRNPAIEQVLAFAPALPFYAVYLGANTERYQRVIESIPEKTVVVCIANLSRFGRAFGNIERVFDLNEYLVQQALAIIKVLCPRQKEKPQIKANIAHMELFDFCQKVLKTINLPLQPLVMRKYPQGAIGLQNFETACMAVTVGPMDIVEEMIQVE